MLTDVTNSHQFGVILTTYFYYNSEAPPLKKESETVSDEMETSINRLINSGGCHPNSSYFLSHSLLREVLATLLCQDYMSKTWQCFIVHNTANMHTQAHTACVY